MIPLVPGAPEVFKPAVERESRMLWAITDAFTVRELVAYDCQDAKHGYWWLPDLGLSMRMGFELFEDERSALEQLLVLLEGRKAVVKKKIEDADFRILELEKEYNGEPV